MSVAFRRESDDEHMEPAFEWPIPVGPNLVTPRGLRLLGDEAARLADAIAGATEEEARKKLLRRQRYIHTRQSTAEVQAAPAADVVGIGSKVSFALNGNERTLTIVGHDEADPAQGTIAFSSPVARALMGAEAGETLEYQGREDAIIVIAATADPETQA
ncbi:MAG: GreA/GreB family elongation factor [Sphingopyxis sp.]|uniref:GreA/GreB family elongation factor n=1 Tax=Sphingopyxis sp. TaxID=1908224 RepID=UPI003D6CA866